MSTPEIDTSLRPARSNSGRSQRPLRVWGMFTPNITTSPRPAILEAYGRCCRDGSGGCCYQRPLHLPDTQRQCWKKEETQATRHDNFRPMYFAASLNDGMHNSLKPRLSHLTLSLGSKKSFGRIAPSADAESDTGLFDKSDEEKSILRQPQKTCVPQQTQYQVVTTATKEVESCVIYVINPPLIEQTRRTRMAQGVADSRDRIDSQLLALTRQHL